MPASSNPFQVSAEFSPGFADWLGRRNVSLACTTYVSNQLIFLGRDAKGEALAAGAPLNRPTGLALFGGRLFVGCHNDITRFENILGPDEIASGMFDRQFVPRNVQITGYLDIHELVIEDSGRLLFTNSQHSCVATLSQRQSFKTVWQPKFISQLVPEDRCHLNGLALENGRLRYVTVCGLSDTEEGWRADRLTGGAVIDVATDTVLSAGLGMPHSPRLHGGQLYLLSSNNGYLVRIDPQTGHQEAMTFFPGFARGMAIHDNHAIVAVSLPRWGKSFEGLAVAAAMKERGLDAWRGLQIVDLATGEVVEWARFDGDITELFDVCILPNVRCAQAITGAALRTTGLVREEL